MPFQAFYAVGHNETFVVPAWCDHLHIFPRFDGGGLFVENVAVIPGEKLTVRVGLSATGVAGGWPDGGNAGADLPVAPFSPFHAKGGGGSSAVLRGDQSVLLCAGGVPGTAAAFNDRTGTGGLFAVGDPLPGLSEDPRVPDPDAFVIPHYVAPQFPLAGLPMVYQWNPGNPGGVWRGGTGIVATNPTAGATGGAALIASSGGGGGYGGGASGGYECLQIHTDPMGDGTGDGGSNLVINQTYFGRRGGSVTPPSDGSMSAMTSDEAAVGGVLVSNALTRRPAGQSAMIAFYWPHNPGQGWAISKVAVAASDALTSFADALGRLI